MTLWFTARSVTQNVDNEVWNQLVGFLTRRGIVVANLDPVARTLDTDLFYATGSLRHGVMRRRRMKRLRYIRSIVSS